MGGALAEEANQPLRPMEVAVEDDDAQEATRDEAVDDRPRAAPGPQHDRRAWHLLAPDQLVESDLEGRHVGVVADQPAALAGDGVDRARRLRVLGQAVDHGHHPLLVRDGHVGAQVVVAPQPLDRFGQLGHGHIEQLIASVDAGRVEGGLLHGSGERVGDRVSDEDEALAHARILSRSRKKAG